MFRGFAQFGRTTRTAAAEHLDGEAFPDRFAALQAPSAAADDGALPYFRSVGASAAPTDRPRAAGPSPTSTQEISFINGLNPNGTLTNTSYWGASGQTAFKWGDTVLGTGATITYSFATASRFTAIEKQTFLKAFEMWESVTNVTFVEVASNSAANVLLKRGNDGGAYTSTPTSDGSGSTPGSVTGQALISIDTSVPGFDLSGSLDRFGGYGMSTIIHEVGHLLGLGHGGAYNGDVTPRTDQFSAFDDRMFTIMSYVNWTNTDAKYASQNPFGGADWGQDNTGNNRTAPHSWMALDIAAIQQIYGVSQNSAFAGGQTYGFHSNIEGVLGDFFDFSANSSPVVTLYNQGVGNTLDLTEFFVGGYVDLRPGAFSSVGGLTNNLCVAFGTRIETAICGFGNDTIVASDVASRLSGGGGADALYGGKAADVLGGDGGGDWLIGNAGKDALTGGSGADIFWFLTPKDSGKAVKTADVIADFERLDGDLINLSNIDAAAGGADNAFRFIGTSAFSRSAGELRYQLVGANAQVSGDVNGDGTADFMIVIQNAAGVIATDFVL